MQESAVGQMSTAELIRQTVNKLSALLDKQVQLAGLELKEDISIIIRGLAVLIIGLVGLFIASIALMIAIILALSAFMPGWLAALIFAVLFLIVGVILTLRGRSELKVRMLGRTRDTLMEDVEWVGRQLTSNGR